MARVIYSLCDYSGNWPRPYAKAGYDVRLVDIKHGQDILTLQPPSEPVYGVLAAPPCTDFSLSGAQYWPAKDADGRTAQSVAIVRACLRFIEAVKPVFWALENPIGRIAALVPELGHFSFEFDPCDFGDAYTKRTRIWGNFNPPYPLFLGETRAVEPVVIRVGGKYVCADGKGKRYSPLHASTGGKSEKTKTLRSMTPEGFARAFFEVNQDR